MAGIRVRGISEITLDNCFRISVGSRRQGASQPAAGGARVPRARFLHSSCRPGYTFVNVDGTTWAGIVYGCWLSDRRNVRILSRKKLRLVHIAVARRFCRNYRPHRQSNGASRHPVDQVVEAPDLLGGYRLRSAHYCPDVRPALLRHKGDLGETCPWNTCDFRGQSLLILRCKITRALARRSVPFR